MTDSLQITCDNMALGDDGKMRLFEAMHSGFTDLSNDPTEVVARIHPVKQKTFDEIVNGAHIEVRVRNNRGGETSVTIHDDITLYVNQPTGGEPHPLSYASIMARHRRSFGEVHARGFDANAEPLIRQMPDRSFRLVFCTMPPRAHALGDAFNMNDFAKRLIKLTDAKITWDDRDVFHIESAKEADIRAILQFLQTYGKD